MQLDLCLHNIVELDNYQVNIPQGSEFETESSQAGLRAQPPLPNVCPDFDKNIPILGGYSEDDSGIHQRKPASVNEHGDTTVHQSEDIVEQYDASHHEHSSLSPNINLNDQQIAALNDQLQKLKEDKEESEANINLRETLKEKAGIELKRVVDEQCVLEFADLPRQLDAKILECKNLEEKNANLEAELRSKSGLEDCNQYLFVELNKNFVVLQSHQLVSDIILAKKYEDLLAAHEDVKKKLIVKEDFVSHSK
ncbi:hypothetical protein GIB67_039804 [Kingdonia uniflora]|uniref:Uncharacterized protein n=1 Tax=Kingdonia uniflora TaxID=39325 RepID=A0A7J7P3G0_9MAGN|nr:hypothetical protein GIB67_039804 [Kingdonia uniflora]